MTKYRFERFKHIIYLAVAYWITGIAGISLAIPPGYASPIFPAAGIAVGALLARGVGLWPGVFLGSFALNMSISLYNNSSAHLPDIILLSAIIGIGAFSHAFVSTQLIRRFLGTDNPLIDIRDSLILYSISGPIGCLLSSFIGSFSLYLFKIVPLSQIVSNWGNWWIGDTFGVLIFTPIVISLFSLNRNHWQSRKLYIVTVLLLSFGVNVGVFLWSKNQFQEKMSILFNANTFQLHKKLDTRLEENITMLNAIERYFTANKKVTRKQFSIFTQDILRGHSEFQALSWIPSLREEDIDKYNLLARNDGLKSFKIWSTKGARPLINFTYPVYYIEPLTGNEKALGYNLASNDERLRTAIVARDTGRPSATGKIQLVQHEKDQAGFIIFFPIYDSDSFHKTKEERIAHHRGFATAPFSVHDFVSRSIEAEEFESFIITITDLNEEKENKLLYTNRPKQYKNMYPFLHTQRKLHVGDRTWMIEYEAGPAFIPYDTPFQLWAIFVFGLVISAALGAFALYLSGQNILFANLVAQRTDELEKSNAQLIKATNVKSQFLANMSHEIRTPMNGIIGMAQILMKSTLTEEKRPLINDILISATDLLNIINDILDISKIESDKIELENAPFHLSHVIKSISSLFTPMAKEKQLFFNIDLDEEIPEYFIGDSSRLKQILVNLVGNSLKFTHRGGITLHIVGKKISEKNIELSCSVKDTGIGIPADRIDSLFQSFTQADSTISRRYGGTGLGLYLTKQLVNLMGGDVTVQSKEGIGTEFLFTIVLEETSESLVHRMNENSEVDLPLMNFPPISILFAEDVDTNIKLGKLIFDRLNLPITIAKTGEEAVKLNESQNFDIIFMDMQMPVLDGLEATRQIRKKVSLKRPYIVALTANAYREDKQRCLDAGMDDFLSKPFKLEDINRMIIKVTSLNRIGIMAQLPKKVLPDDLLDDEQISQISSLSPTALRDLSKQFFNKEEQFIADLKKAIESKSIETVDNILHRFRGSALNLGAKKLGENLTKVTTEEELEKINEKLPYIQELIQETKEAINKRYLDNEEEE